MELIIGKKIPAKVARKAQIIFETKKPKNIKCQKGAVSWDVGMDWRILSDGTKARLMSHNEYYKCLARKKQKSIRV